MSILKLSSSSSIEQSYIGEQQRNQREFYNTGKNSHIIIESSDDDDDNDTTTTSSGAYVPASSDDDEEDEKEAEDKRGPVAPGAETGHTDSGRPRAPKVRRVEVTEENGEAEEEVSTVDEGIGTKVFII